MAPERNGNTNFFEVRSPYGCGSEENCPLRRDAVQSHRSSTAFERACHLLLHSPDPKVAFINLFLSDDKQNQYTFTNALNINVTFLHCICPTSMYVPCTLSYVSHPYTSLLMPSCRNCIFLAQEPG